MAYTKAGQKAVDKYIKNNYEQFSVRFKKGEKQRFAELAKLEGKSLNQLIIDLLREEEDAYKTYQWQRKEENQD